jgi:hypothetical protein
MQELADEAIAEYFKQEFDALDAVEGLGRGQKEQEK